MLARVLLAAFVATVSAESWSVTEHNVTCVVLSSTNVVARVNIVGDDNVTKPFEFNINETVSVGGRCTGEIRNGSAVNLLVASFFPNGKQPQHATDGQPWRLMLWFGSDEKENQAFKLVDYVLEAAATPAFNFSDPQNFTKSSSAEIDLAATGTNGFKCSVSGLALSSESTVEFKDVRAIANARFDHPGFPDQQLYEQCLLDTRTSDIVPIVVGACLAGLVVVVLIAYLVGRARAKRQGYASV